MIRFVVAASVALLVTGCGDAESDDPIANDADADATAKSDTNKGTGADRVTLPSGAVVRPDETANFTRGGGSDISSDYTCVYTLEDAEFSAPEGSVYYDSVRIALQFPEYPGCMGETPNPANPQSVVFETDAKVRDGIGDARAGFGQTKMRGTLTADGKATEVQATCTMQVEDYGHEMTCQINGVPVGDLIAVESDPEDKFSIIAGARFLD